jgi:hypothetical protein
MKVIQYPGKSIKQSWWDRLVSWFLNWRYSVKTTGVTQSIEGNQQIIDQMMGQIVDNQKLSIMPPHTTKGNK